MNSPCTSYLLHSNVTNITTQLIIIQINELAKIASQNHDILLDELQEHKYELNKPIQEIKAIKPYTQDGNQQIKELSIQIENFSKSEQLYNNTKFLGGRMLYLQAIPLVCIPPLM